MDEIDQKVKPLDDDDVDAVVRKTLALNDSQIKQLNDIYKQFDNCISSLLSMASKTVTNETELVELERVKRILKIPGDDEKFIRSKDKLWAVRNQIINKDENYFLNKDYTTIIKKDSKQAMIECVLNIIKYKFINMNPSEKAVYWTKAGEMLKYVIKYKQLMGEVVYN